MPGMNERLTVRNPHAEIFRWLPIRRCDLGHGSAQGCSAAKRPGVLGAIKGDIGAAPAKEWNGCEKIAVEQTDGRKTWHSAREARLEGFFSSRRRGPKEDARSSGLAEKDLTFYANRFT
ncbi:hypothetical protein [Bradyrhizobium sp.]|uniref:hypothetical protein n=1 Tax=Bradyrhizobium sp. TaxID=376 RepID=UPI002D1FB83A|nr:hypothetical protein [Bradyrhizobium sp.]